MTQQCLDHVQTHAGQKDICERYSLRFFLNAFLNVFNSMRLVCEAYISIRLLGRGQTYVLHLIEPLPCLCEHDLDVNFILCQSPLLERCEISHDVTRWSELPSNGRPLFNSNSSHRLANDDISAFQIFFWTFSVLEMAATFFRRPCNIHKGA
jgi:hypothetical protein